MSRLRFSSLPRMALKTQSILGSMECFMAAAPCGLGLFGGAARAWSEQGLVSPADLVGSRLAQDLGQDFAWAKVRPFFDAGLQLGPKGWGQGLLALGQGAAHGAGAHEAGWADARRSVFMGVFCLCFCLVLYLWLGVWIKRVGKSNLYGCLVMLFWIKRVGKSNLYGCLVMLFMLPP